MAVKEEKVEVTGEVIEALGAATTGSHSRTAGTRSRLHGGQDAQVPDQDRGRRPGSGGAFAVRPDPRKDRLPGTEWGFRVVSALLHGRDVGRGLGRVLGVPTVDTARSSG